MAVTCINLNCVIISVDFRNGPEIKCPRGQLDYLESINYIYANPTQFGIDHNKICIAGIDGGGWIITGAANLLAK